MTLRHRLGLPEMRGHKALVAAFLIDALGTGLYLPFSLLYFQRVVGLALPAIGVALTIATFLTLPMTPITGALADRFGGQRLVVVSQLLQAIGFLGYLVVHSIPMLLAMTLLTTAGTRIFYTASTVLIADVAEIDERDRWYGFIGATQSLGLGAGGLLAGFIVAFGGTIGYHVLILANVLSFLLMAILLHWHKVPPQHVSMQATQTESNGYRAVLADRPFLVLVACNVIFTLDLCMVSTGFPLYVTESLNISTAVLGTLYAFGTLLTISTQTLVLRFLATYRRTRSLAIASLLRAVAYVLLALALFLPHLLLVPYLFGTIAVDTLAALMMTPTAMALVAGSSSDHLRGRYLGIYQFSWGISAAATPTIFTFLYARGPLWPWVALIGPLLIAGFVLLRIEPHLPASAVHVSQKKDVADKQLT